MTKIQNKPGGSTSTVPDEMCEACSQCWEGECRMYQKPQSNEEFAQRYVLDPWKLPPCVKLTQVCETIREIAAKLVISDYEAHLAKQGEGADV